MYQVQNFNRVFTLVSCEAAYADVLLQAQEVDSLRQVHLQEHKSTSSHGDPAHFARIQPQKETESDLESRQS